jgi:hypothetical protein
MKRKLILFLCCLAYTLTTLAQTDLYKRYASRTDIRVASVTNFTLDTGITADVTLLEAVDDQGWEWLCKEFNLAPLSQQQQQQMDEGWDVALFTQRNRQDPTKPAPVVNEQIDHNCSCYVGVSYLSRTLYIFCCNTDRQSDVVVNYLIEKMRRSIHAKE